MISPISQISERASAEKVGLRKGLLDLRNLKETHVVYFDQTSGMFRQNVHSKQRAIQSGAFAISIRRRRRFKDRNAYTQGIVKWQNSAP
jgi:hypothetical protein